MDDNNKRKLSAAEASAPTISNKAARTMTSASTNITDVATHLHNLLQLKEKELQEREVDFDRRVKTFESTNPSIGEDNDVIQLNVGGHTSIAVLRSTLTQYEDSMLAAKFSGRWDDSMEKDKDGNIFIDQDPEQFMILINYLRLRMNNRLRSVPERHLPDPTYAFCTMLEYYNLMPGLYPQSWISDQERFTCEEIAYGMVKLSSKSNEGDSTLSTASVVHPFGRFANAGVLEFTVEFGKNTCGSVGWIYYGGEDIKKIQVSSYAFNEPKSNSLLLNIAERKVFGPGEVLNDNMRINHIDSTTHVTCKHDGNTGYSLELGDGTNIDATVEGNKNYNGYHVYPMISFSGEVTVSGLKYAIDQLS